MKTGLNSIRCLIATALLLFLSPVTDYVYGQDLNKTDLAKRYYGNDKNWFLENIPFFECSDKAFEEVYYYRWNLYKAHIRNTGPGSYVITEFINHMPWDIEPYCTINAASMHHIYEGRWLNNKKYVNSYIDYMYQNGGNNRSYSESIADATFANYLVSGDKEFAVSQLDSMISSYNGWYDHWDKARQLYYIPAMPDATEFNIAAVDASGGIGGFEGGEAFRPTINSYQYGNALAISGIADLAGKKKLSQEFQSRATELKNNIQLNLWNEDFQHFTDRYKVSNNYVSNWDFIRGRELAGFAPWYFNLPDDDKKYHKAFTHLTDSTHLLGREGYRTNEPSYEYYFRQNVYFEGLPSSQWNGPSWPFQTSIALTGMANFLQKYNQDVITVSDYLHGLRLFTKQHYLPDGSVNLGENYDPNKGGPIVFCKWSNHYLHSTYNNLIISGLCGIQPQADETLRIQPLIDNSISYFYLSELEYHGHKVSVIFDRTGERYSYGKGLTVIIDGKQVKAEKSGSYYTVTVGKTVIPVPEKIRANLLLNISFKGFPKVSSSVNTNPELIKQINDGRIWYFPESENRWISLASPNDTDWIQAEFETQSLISEIALYTYVDNMTYLLPESLSVKALINGTWKEVGFMEQPVLTANTRNILKIKPVNATAIKLYFNHKSKQIAFTEIEAY